MDAFDLFRQLSCGTRITKRKKDNHNPKPAPSIPTNEEESPLSELPVENSESDHEEGQFQYFDGDDVSSKPKKKKRKIELTKEQKDKQMEELKVATIRRENRIKVLGKNIPAPITSFDELRTIHNIHDSLVANLIACNYPQPTPVQMQAIPILLNGRPLMACAPTGSGKTIAFLTPIINDLRGPKKAGFRAIVLAPTRELAQQIYRECVRLSEKTALKIHIISKVNQAEQKFGPNSSKKFDILISTPNRVRFLLQQEPPVLDLKSIEWFVIDEADRLMEDGQDSFKDQIDDILAACTNPKKKLALFSATYTVPVAKWALRNLKNLIRLTVGEQNSATETVEQELLFVGSESGKLLAVRNMVRSGLKPPVLVFVQSKDRAKQLFEELLYDGINVDVIHADRTQQQRDNCVRAFREGNIWVLICTELMGRGIDFKGVNLVINYDFPPSTISYIHRIGRAGRAGRTGKAITFFTQDDKPNLRSIAEIIKKSGGKVPDFMLEIKKPKKSERKMLMRRVPEREEISTKLKPEISQKQKNLQKLNEKGEVDSDEKKKSLKKDEKMKNNGKLKKLTEVAGGNGAANGNKKGALKSMQKIEKLQKKSASKKVKKVAQKT